MSELVLLNANAKTREAPFKTRDVVDGEGILSHLMDEEQGEEEQG
jgi:hypothetical protein